MSTRGTIDKPFAIACAFAAFVLYSTVNILQSPFYIGSDATESTVLVVAKACTALLLALYILKVGTSIRRLAMIWGIAALFFLFSPVFGFLSDAPLANYLYFLTLGFAVSSGLLLITALLSLFEWKTVKYLIVIQHMLAGLAPYAIEILEIESIKANAYFFYVLFSIAVVIFISTKVSSLSNTFEPVKMLSNKHDTKSRFRLILIAMAIGGAAQAIFFFGFFEQFVNSAGLALFRGPAFTLANNFGIPLLILLAFLFKKNISIEVSFFLVSIVTFVFLLGMLYNPHLSALMFNVSQSLVTFYHLAIWLFIFRTGKSGPIEACVFMGFSVFTISVGRILGNLTAGLALSLPDATSSLDTIVLYALVVFVLINLGLFLATHLLHKRTAKDEPPVVQVEKSNLSFEQRAQTLADKYALSKREREILLEYSAGRTAPFIAEKLYLSVFTVKNYISRMYAKMDIHSRQELLDLLEAEKTLANKTPDEAESAID